MARGVAAQNTALAAYIKKRGLERWSIDDVAGELACRMESVDQAREKRKAREEQTRMLIDRLEGVLVEIEAGCSQQWAENRAEEAIAALKEWREGR